MPGWREAMISDGRPRCTKCDGVVDSKGVNGANAAAIYCEHRCGWPVYSMRADGTLCERDDPGRRRRITGCDAPIYFIVNARENLQPFDRIEGGGPHHATCPAYREWKALMRSASRGLTQIACPRCGKVKGRRGPCGSCGWRPGQQPQPAVRVERCL